ncbi:MAG TPA: site-2 protease family protein [Candidatus Saccharimonadales bacterium]|jgi:Zn-dependent protease
MVELIIIIAGILLSVTIHEAVHAFTSHWLGDDTAFRLGRLTLNPLKHIDPFSTILLPLFLVSLGLPPFAAAKPVPFNPSRVRWGEYGAALVGISGPLSNLIIAALVGVWGQFVIGFDGGGVSDVMVLLVQINLALFVFNMIPWPPLDGSRLLYAFAPDGLRRLMSQIESFGLLGIGIFMFTIFPLLSSTFVRAVEVMFELITGIRLL